MFTYSIIKKSQLEGALRLDAEYYQPEKLNFIKILTLKGKRRIRDEFIIVNEVFDPKRNTLREPTIVFDLPDIQNYLLEKKEPIKNISEIGSTKKIFQQGDVIISRLRPYLKEVTYVGFNENLKLASTEFIVLRKKKDSFYYPQTLFVFLITDMVQIILTQSMGGAEHPRFKEDILLDLYLPNISQNLNEEIKNLVDKAYILHLNSHFLYSQAENLLLEELGLKDFKVEDDLSYIVNLSQIKSAHRADAEYFQPKYERLIKRIEKFSEPLLKVVDNIPARFNPYLTPDKIFKYVELEHINTSIGIIDGYIEILGNEAPSRAKRVLKEKDVIFSSVEGSLKKVALVHKEQEGYLASTGFFQFRCKKVLPEYFLVLAKSIVLQMQFEKETAGTILTAVPKEAIKNVLIPILPKPTQQKIADLVQKSHEARKKAKELLEKAKQKVEELIEKG